MKNPQLKSPTNPHFFQPLLSGSDTQLTIPNAFFSKHIEGKKRYKTAKLRSNSSDKTWEVKIDGQRLTVGWRDFYTSHDFRIRDIIVFKHQGDMVFHVTPFGPSCCELQYSKPHIISDDDEEEEEEEEEEEDNEVPKPKTEATESSLSSDYCFVAKVTASNLQVDTIHLPVEAANSKALSRRCKKVIVVNKKGKSWTLDLRFKESGNCYYISGGWRSFCNDNKLKEEDLIPFNLVGNGLSTPMLCICSEEECTELMKEYTIKERTINKKTERCRNLIPSTSSRHNRFVTITLTSYNIRTCKLILPQLFIKTNGINKCKEITLMDKNGGRRLVKMVKDGTKFGRRGLGRGWKEFCEANDVLKIGVPFVLEFIWEDERPALKFCSKVKAEST